MIVLHAGALDGKLMLWGEAPEEPESTRLRSRRLRTALRGLATLEPLPYDAGEEKLLASLREAGFNAKLDKKSIGSVVVWLPTVNNKPIPSSSLIGQPPESVASATPRPWITGWIS